MAGSITTKQVYEAVIDLGKKFEGLKTCVEAHSTAIALLQQRDANHRGQEDKRDRRIESLDDAVRAIQVDNARATRNSAVIAALIAIIPTLIVIFTK